MDLLQLAIELQLLAVLIHNTRSWLELLTVAVLWPLFLACHKAVVLHSPVKRDQQTFFLLVINCYITSEKDSLCLNP